MKKGLVSCQETATDFKPRGTCASSAQAEDVAQMTIGGATTPYATITEAWTAAQAGTAEDHATLTLLTNVTVTAALSNTAVMTLDLNGYVLQQKTDGQNVLQNTGTLTINDSRYDSPDYRHYFVRDESGNWSLVENETGDTVYGGGIRAGRWPSAPPQGVSGDADARAAREAR